MGLDAVVFAEVDKYERIVWRPMSRYFSEWYRRGNWPSIRTIITTLQERFPEYQVYYVSDAWGEYHEHQPGDLMTPERLAELDAEWARFIFDENDEEVVGK